MSTTFGVIDKVTGDTMEIARRVGISTDKSDVTITALGELALFISNINVDSQRAKYPNLCDLADELQHGQLKKFFEKIVKAEMPNFMRIEVISDIGPFYLKPHNDFSKKLTILCYTNYSARYPGTTIYSDANTIHHQIESQDNRCVFFVPNHVTWHGVPKTVFPTVRRMLMINYFVSLDQLSPPQLN